VPLAVGACVKAVESELPAVLVVGAAVSPPSTAKAGVGAGVGKGAGVVDSGSSLSLAVGAAVVVFSSTAGVEVGAGAGDEGVGVGSSSGPAPPSPVLAVGAAVPLPSLLPGADSVDVGAAVTPFPSTAADEEGAAEGERVGCWASAAG
jgi:hypothetical protein